MIVSGSSSKIACSLCLCRPNHTPQAATRARMAAFNHTKDCDLGGYTKDWSSTLTLNPKPQNTKP